MGGRKGDLHDLPDPRNRAQLARGLPHLRDGKRHEAASRRGGASSNRIASTATKPLKGVVICATLG